MSACFKYPPTQFQLPNPNIVPKKSKLCGLKKYSSANPLNTAIREFFCALMKIDNPL